ncbi:FAD:protein FMN transferase [Actinoallomurus sp. NPDC050550]|uniref:FAD:protein FMN transferase n=1 Tax=Actinoallomurus sp. NPDC050550 TaxID=3154937 RepID=UPI0033C374DB
MSTAQETFPLWGGSATVAVTEPDRLAVARAAVDRVIRDVDAACSAYRDDSDLARVNAGSGYAVRVSTTFLEVLQAALRAAELTGGLVDPTAVGRSAGAVGLSVGTEITRPNDVAAFRTGTETGRSPRTEDASPNNAPAFRTNTETGQSAGTEDTRPNDIAAFRAGAEAGRSRLGPGFAVPTGKDWRSIEIIPASTTVSVPRGLTLDFGAVGKAFAADRAAAEASAAAGCGVLVALAGDIAVAGPVPVNGWPVRVADDHRLRSDGGLPPGQDITLRAPGGLATSSLAVRTRRMADGRTVTHIVDPRTGMPVRGPWRTVSVSAGTCVDANTASTAALVRGHGAGGWLARHGLPSRLVHADGWVHTIVGWPDDHSERPGVKVAG